MKLSQKVKKKIIIISGSVILALGIIVIVGKKYDIEMISSVADVITYPFQKTVTILSDKVSGVSRYFKNLDTLIAENEKLTKDNERLIYENTILEQFRNENIQLKGLLEIEQRYRNYPNVGANVIGKDPGNWYKIFSVDKGLTDEIESNQVILSGGGLVGHVIEVTPFSSKVLSIIDDRSYVSAKVVRTGDIGILRGDIELTNKGMCKMEIDIESEVVKGDQIITSHLSDIYPPGIPIGVVEEVTIGKNGLTQYAYIKPFVDFKHLENVLVIKNE
ncbi:MAG: rod shape-determining protein MreC [Cellulosilyticaceae bacterium]